MTEITLEDANPKSRAVRRFGLTKQQIFRLWRAAIKDDETLRDRDSEREFHSLLTHLPTYHRGDLQLHGA